MEVREEYKGGMEWVVFMWLYVAILFFITSVMSNLLRVAVPQHLEEGRAGDISPTNFSEWFPVSLRGFGTPILVMYIRCKLILHGIID